MRKWISGVLFSFGLVPLYAQTQTVNQQVWLEYMGNYPFANSFNFENAVAYNTVLNSSGWKDYSYSGTLEWSITQSVEPIAQVLLDYTQQTATSNTFEVRPVIGCRFYFTSARRIQTRLLVRFEDRNFKDIETGVWTQAFRPRVRAEALIPITQDSYFKDKLLYGILDVEAIFTTNDVKERFANRLRLRTGIGYRFSYSLRLEFIYMYQQSRDGIDEDFSSSDNIFRFRVKQYFRKSKPSTASGTGN